MGDHAVAVSECQVQPYQWMLSSSPALQQCAHLAILIIRCSSHLAHEFAPLVVGTDSNPTETQRHRAPDEACTDYRRVPMTE